MAKFKTGLRKTAAILLSSLTAMSAVSVMTAVSASAVSYSDMSALDQYAYSGNDLGANYSKNSTTFKVWAPTASKVQLKRYKTGSDSESGAGVIETKDMTKQSQGIWSITVSGDLAGTYYTYLVTVDGTTRETVDIYAKSTGVNGKRGMVIDLDSTDPAGWDNDKRITCKNQTDAIIWEAHVRDFSASSDSGMKNKGKYLAFTETGTTVNNDGVHPTGIDYLADLGVTHVHLLPVYDYGSVDETKLSTDQFNWGYDPMNYNTPEGSYSTNPYDGNVRVNEFKQMVQSLHSKGIGVVMDVVYNHTYAGSSNINDWFNYTVPNYYYRQNSKGTLSDASGCGNETASDRAMYQKFMIDSLTYWATEYHLDGFRFDLMGIHDTDTMNAIRAAMDKIDPQIILYGEPWTAAETPCPKATAVQGNMYLVSEEVAAFNDKVRDAIKGSCFNAADKGFIQGAANFETALKGGIQANSTDMAGSSKWSKQPSQTVTYTSAHDNYTLYDKLVKSCYGGSGYGQRRDDLVAMNKMAGGIILTSQGMSFFQAGEEFARTKGGDENSYKSPTSVNQLNWQNTITYSDIVSYYKGLIEIRKAYYPFRDPTNTSNNTIYFSWGDNCPANVVAFTMYNKSASSNEWNFAAVLHNANSSSKQVKLQTYDGVTLPSQWVIVADGTSAGTKSLGTSGTTVTVPARSTMVLIDKTSFDNTDLDDTCTVSVNHIKKDNNSISTEVIKGKEGTAYTTSPLASLLNSGYKLVSTEGAVSGTFSKNPVTVSYYYELDSTKYGTVNVEYIDDETGEKIADDDSFSGLIGSSYSISATKSITGYAAPTGTKTGTYSSSAQTITFRYTKQQETGLKIHYYNSQNWSKVAMYVYTGSGNSATLYTGTWPGTLMTSEGDNWYVGNVSNVDSALFIANNNGGGSQDPSGDRPDGHSVSGECWVKGSKVYHAGTVKVIYSDTTGKVLSSMTLKGMADGTNKYTTTAKEFSGYTLSSTPSNATGVYTEGTVTVQYIYKSNETAPLTNSSKISSTSVNAGTAVTLTAEASGGTAPYLYTYRYRKSGNTSWTTSGASNVTTATKSLTIKTAGTYDVAILVKDSTGTVKSKTFTLTVISPSNFTNNSTISAATVAAGTAVKLTAKASGGTAPYLYTYRYRKSGNTSWTTAGSSNVTATTKSITINNAGTYEVAVLIKDANLKVVSKVFTLTVTSNTALTNNSTISAESVTAGTAVKLTAKASGGTAPYLYTYRYRTSGASSWITLGSSNVTETTKDLKLKNAGTYEVAVLIKDANLKVVSKIFSLNVINGSEFTNSSTISATSVASGKSVTLNAKASGGTAPYYYTFQWCSSSLSQWKTIGTRNGSATTATFTPSYADSYELRVIIKDETGTVKTQTFTLSVK